MSEITVILKDTERTYRQKFLTYETYGVNLEDPVLINCIEEAKKNFQGDPEEISIKIHLEVR